MATLDDEQFFRRPAPSVNPIALIAKHQAGNLLPRWSDPFGGDGEPASRDRDHEFVLDPAETRDALMARWRDGWAALESILATLSPSDLDRRILIRTEPHTVGQALVRGATHAAHHVGKILYLARMVRPGSPHLTVAPGASASTRGGYLSPTGRDSEGRSPGEPQPREPTALRVCP